MMQTGRDACVCDGGGGGEKPEHWENGVWSAWKMDKQVCGWTDVRNELVGVVGGGGFQLDFVQRESDQGNTCW